MGKNKSLSVCDKVMEFAAPLAGELGFEIFDMEYVKEGSEYYLRIYIDRLDGESVDLNDCEKYSRAIDPILDEKDVVPTQYIFEAASPGLDRPLKREKDFIRFLGSDIDIKFFKPLEGIKEKAICAKLIDYKDDIVTIEYNEERINFEKSQAAVIKLAVVF